MRVNEKIMGGHVDIGIKQYYQDYIHSLGDFQKKELIFQNTNKESVKYSYKLSKSIFSKIVKSIIQKIWKKMMLERLHYIMPNSMGSVDIVQYKIKVPVDENGNIKKDKLVPDWGSTRKLWQKLYPGKTIEELRLIKHKKVLYFLNEHTDSMKVHTAWKKSDCRVKNHTLYYFWITFTNQRMLAKAIKTIGLNKLAYPITENIFNSGDKKIDLLYN